MWQSEDKDSDLNIPPVRDLTQQFYKRIENQLDAIHLNLHLN